MADPVEKPAPVDDGIVDLQNDARWQARLEEARARRAEALKRAGKDDNDRRAPRKPWEEESEARPTTAPRAKADAKTPRPDGIDFHDRMSALRKHIDRDKESKSDLIEPGHNRRAESKDYTLEPPRPVKTNTPKPTEKPRSERVDAIFGDPIFQASEREEETPKLVDPIDLKSTASEPAPWRRGWAELEHEEAIEEARIQRESELVEDAEAFVAPTRTNRAPGQMPAGLGLSLLALAALPFLNLLPPLERGPDETQALGFAVQPAFGITSAMLERPVQTQSNEWQVPASFIQVVPMGALQAPPPEFSRALIVMPPVASGPDDIGAIGRPDGETWPGPEPLISPKKFPAFAFLGGDLVTRILAEQATVRPAPRPTP